MSPRCLNIRRSQPLYGSNCLVVMSLQRFSKQDESSACLYGRTALRCLIKEQERPQLLYGRTASSLLQALLEVSPALCSQQTEQELSCVIWQNEGLIKEQERPQLLYGRTASSRLQALLEVLPVSCEHHKSSAAKWQNCVLLLVLKSFSPLSAEVQQEMSS